MNIYLAGKVSVHKDTSIKWRVVESIHRGPNHFICTDGDDYSNSSLHGAIHNDESCFYYVEHEHAHPFDSEHAKIPAKFINLIHDCDLLLAILLGEASYGSIAEMAYASAIGKPVHAIIPEGSEEHLDLYWFVLGMPGCFVYEVEDEREATAKIIKIIESEIRKPPASSVRATAWQATFKSKKTKDEWWACYQEYLKSPEWQAKRKAVLERCGGICEGCRTAPAWIVHHLSYKNVGNELLFELAAVCKACHEISHPEKNFDKEFEPINDIVDRVVTRRGDGNR